MAGCDRSRRIYLGVILPDDLYRRRLCYLWWLVALFAGESVAIADVHTDPSLVPHLAAYQQLGLQAFAAIPNSDFDNGIGGAGE